MMKVYALISAAILFAVLMFGPLFSLTGNNANVAVSWNTTPVFSWVAGPFGEGK